MPQGPGEVGYLSPNGETVWGLPGIDVPEGWTRLQEWSQPTQPGLEDPLIDPADLVAPGVGGLAGGLLGKLVTRGGRIGLGAIRGGGIAKRSMNEALQSGEMISGEQAANAVSTAVQRGALSGAKQRAAEEALTGPSTSVAGGQLQIPIENMDIIRRLGGKLRGANIGEGKMLTRAAKGGLEEAGTPGAEQLLQALSDFAVRKRLTPAKGPLSVLDLHSYMRPLLALWKANQVVRPNPMAEWIGTGIGAGAGATGGYLSQRLAQ